MQLADEDEQELKRLEELWRSPVRFSPEKMDRLLADDLEFGSSSRIYDKRKTLETPVQKINAQLPLIRFQKALASFVT